MEPLEDLLDEKWDEESSEKNQQLRAPKFGADFTSSTGTGKPKVEAKYPTEKLPKVHLSEKLEVVYSRSLGEFESSNVETSASFGSDDSSSKSQQEESFTHESIDSATVATYMTSDANLVRVEKNVMNLLNKMQCEQIDTVHDQLKNVERSFRGRNMLCGEADDADDDYVDDVFSEELFVDEDTATFHSGAFVSVSSDVMDDDSAEVEALVEELEVNEFFSKTYPKNKPTWTDTADVAETEMSDIAQEPGVKEGYDIPHTDKPSKGSAWFRKVPLTPRSLTPRPQSPLLTTPPHTKAQQETATGKTASPEKTTPPRLLTLSPEEIEEYILDVDSNAPTPKRGSTNRDTNESSAYRMPYPMDSLLQSNQRVVLKEAESIVDPLVDLQQTEDIKDAAIGKATSPGPLSLLNAPKSVRPETSVTKADTSIVKPPRVQAPVENLDRESAPVPMESNTTAEKDRKVVPMIIPCPAKARTVGASLHEPIKTTVLEIAPTIQAVSKDSAASEEVEIESEITAALIASEAAIGALLALEKDSEGTSNMDELPSHALRDEDNAIEVNGQPQIVCDESVAHDVTKSLSVKVLVEKWEKKVPDVSNEKTNLESDMSIPLPEGIEVEYSHSVSEETDVAIAVMPEPEVELSPVATKSVINGQKQDKDFVEDSSNGEEADMLQLREVALENGSICSVDEATRTAPHSEIASSEEYLGIEQKLSDIAEPTEDLFVPLNEFSQEGVEYTLESSENDRDADIQGGEAEATEEDSTTYGEGGIEFTLDSHEEYAGSVDSDIDPKDKPPSKSPLRAISSSRKILARTPKRISSLWKKHQKKSMATDLEAMPVTEETETSKAAPIQHVLVEEDSSVESKSTQKTPVKSIEEVEPGDRESVKNAAMPESPSSVIDIILSMSERELLASCSQEASVGETLNSVFATDKPGDGMTNKVDNAAAREIDEKKAPPSAATVEAVLLGKKRSRSFFGRRSKAADTRQIKDASVEKIDKGSVAENPMKDESFPPLEAVEKERSTESILQDLVPESSMYEFMDSASSMMDVILGKSRMDAVSSPDNSLAPVKISVLDESEPPKAVDAEKLDGTDGETGATQMESADQTTDEVPAVAEEAQFVDGEKNIEPAKVDDAGEVNGEATTPKRKRSLWKRQTSPKAPSKKKHVDDMNEALLNVYGQAEESVLSVDTSNEEPYTGPIPWKIVCGDETPAATPGATDSDEDPGAEEDAQVRKGLKQRLRTLVRSPSSSSAPISDDGDDEIPLEDSIKVARRSFVHRSFGSNLSTGSRLSSPGQEKNMPRTTGSSSTQKIDNRGIGRRLLSGLRRNDSLTDNDEDLNPLLPGQNEYDELKSKRKAKIKLHRKKYTDLVDEERSHGMMDEVPNTRIVTPPACYDCSPCLPAKVPG